MNEKSDNRKMKNTMILDGSEENDPEAALVIESLVNALRGSGMMFSHHVLRDIVIAPCTGCLMCWTKTPGECLIDDGQRTIYSDMARSDIVVLVTPVTFGGYSSDLKKGMDRLIPVLLPFFKKYDGETHHPARYGNGWNLIGLGTMSCHDQEKEDLFKELVQRNSLNMHSKTTTSLIVFKGWGADEINGKVAEALAKVMA